MELPFLKNKQSGGSWQALATVQAKPDGSTDSQLLEAAADELMDAVHRKDLKALRESLKAILNMLKKE